MKKIIFGLFFSCSTFVYSQSNFGYSFGFSSSFELLNPKQYESDLEYFSSVYSNGYAVNLGVTNKLNYKKFFTRVDFGYNLASQQQTFIFSNAVDLNISHTLRHYVPHCSFDWSIGRDFKLKNNHLLQLELGISTLFSMVVGPYNLILHKSGSFTSTFSDPDEHWSGEMVIKEYNYEIDYDRPTLVTPFFRMGIQVPLGNNYLTYGISAKKKRLVYENFIYLSSDTYSAIAYSRSQSYSIGVFISYQFGNKSRE